MNYLFNTAKDVKEFFSPPSKSDSPNPMPRPGNGKGYKDTDNRRYSLNPFSKDRGHSYGPSDHGSHSTSKKHKNYSSASHTESVDRRDPVKQSSRTDSTHATGSPTRNDRPHEQSSIPKGNAYREGRSYADVTQGDAAHSSTTQSSPVHPSARNGTSISGQTEMPPPSVPARSAKKESGLDVVDGVGDIQRTETRHPGSVPTSSSASDSARVSSSRAGSNHSQPLTNQPSIKGHARGGNSEHKDSDAMMQQITEKYQEIKQQLADRERAHENEKRKLQAHYGRNQYELEQTLIRERKDADALKQGANQQISVLSTRCNQYAAEAERLKAALQAASALSETRAKELSSAKAFLAVVDDSSGADVVKSINSLNDQVLQFSAQFMDMAEIRDVETDIAVDEVGPQISEAKERLRGLFGDQVDELFNLPIDQLEYASQCALQAILLRWCTKVIHAWSLYPEVDNALKEIYGGIQRSISDPALQTIATRWRALTRAQSRVNWEAESQITEYVTKDVMSLLVLVCGARPLSAKEQAQREKRTYDKISDILKLAFQISKVIGEGITSADYELVYPLPGELFDVDSMVDDNEIEGQSESPVQIICTCQLGLLRIQPGAPSRYQILTKARVFLPSALSQF